MTAGNVLPPLPLEEWDATRITLQLYAQIVGKIRLGLMPKRNHWWHVPLYVTSRGWTTGLMPYGDRRLQIDFDFIAHEVGVATVDGFERTIALRGQAVAEFYSELFEILRACGVESHIHAMPYDLPFTTPFPEDREHASYDSEFVNRFWRIQAWSQTVFWEFAGRFQGKTSPVHLFWHSFDLALTLFSGRPAPPLEGANQVAREAYSHEVISFGFWAGDPNVPEPAYYSYTAPEPEGLREQPLAPSTARWIENRGSGLALLPYAVVRSADDPRQELLTFLESSFQAGVRLAQWERLALQGR